MRYSNTLRDLLTEIIRTIPQEPVNIAVLKLAQEGVKKMGSMLAEKQALMDESPISSRARASGRTHRMLIQAIACASEGRSVLVLVGDQTHVREIELRIRELWVSPDGVPPFEPDITVRYYESLERGQVLSGQRFSSIFEDHFVAERRALHWESLKRSLTT